MAGIDPSKIKAMPVQKTVLAINNFVVNTSSFLNNFSNNCEHKMSRISSRVTDLETMLAVFEAKLNSIPMDATTLANAQQAATAAAAPVQQQPVTAAPVEVPAAVPTASLPSIPATPAAPPPPPPPAALAAPAVVAVAAQPTGLLVKDHPDYEPFFKMLKVGLPPFVVQAKMTAAGLNADLLDRPDDAMPSSGATSTPAVAPAAVQTSAPPPPPPPPANISSSASVATTAASAAPSVAPPAPAPAVLPSSAASGGVLIKDHPDYEPFFKMLKVGLPPFVVQAKMTAAGLNADLLDRPDDAMPSSGSTSTPALASATAPAPDDNASVVASVAPSIAVAPAPAAPTVAGGMLVKDHPDYEPFFKMLKVGLPPFVVQAKMTAAGLNADLLDRPDDAI